MPKKTKNDDRFLGDVLVVSVVVFSLIIATVSVLVPIVPPPPPPPPPTPLFLALWQEARNAKSWTWLT